MADYDSFDVKAYLHTRYGSVDAKDRVQFQLEKLHECFEAFSSGTSLKVLDFGSGPVIQHSISAAAYASEIVFCDISASSREAIEKWLKKDPDAFNWSPHFDYVVKTLEGKGEVEARAREEHMRQIAKVAFCDAQSDTPLEKGYEGPYDVILEFGCLMVACSTLQSYQSCMKRIASLLKSGGIFIHYGSNFVSEEKGIKYQVGDQFYDYITLTHECVASILERSSFQSIHTHYIPMDPLNSSGYNTMSGKDGYHFVYSQKI